MENTSVEMTEVAEPSEEVEETVETGAEDLEIAAPESEEHQKTSQDAAFAEQRRAREAAEKELADVRAELEEIRAENEARMEAFNKLTGSENGDIAALSELTGMSEDEIKSVMADASEQAQKDLRISQLEQQLLDVEAERHMQSDLATLQRIDPKIKSLTDLPPEYMKYIGAGLEAEDAYWACKAKEAANHVTPPKPAGQVKTGTAEKEYFTESEIDSMSSEQLKKNWKKVFSSWG